MIVNTQIKLYHFEACPYCEKVRRALDYYELSYESHIIDPSDRSEVREISGQSLVPVIVDGDNVVYDSTEIIKYLDEHYSNSLRLIPVEPHQRAHALIWNEFGELSWGNLGYQAQKGTDKAGHALSPEDKSEVHSELVRESALLDSYLSEAQFLVDDSFSIADITLSSFISRLEEFSDYTIPEEHTNVRKWYERVDALLKSKETEPVEP